MSGQLSVALRKDETLYSAIGRLWWYLGSPPKADLHRVLFGDNVTAHDDLPMGLQAVVASGAIGAADLGDAAHRSTLFPYFSHHADPCRAQATLSAMGSSGVWPPQVLGCANDLSSGRLRFCPRCREEMLTQHTDAWWVRSHQLPSALVCPVHNERLRESAASREMCRKTYILATELVCPTGAPAVIGDVDCREMADLDALARASSELLDRRCELHPDDRRENYLRHLKDLGMLNRLGAANLHAVARSMDARYGATLLLWPELVLNGRCAQGWLGRLLMGERGSPPLHHLLFQGWLSNHP